MSDRIAVINKGRIAQLDTPRRLYEQPADRFVAEFIGESTFLPVTSVSGGYLYAGERLKLPPDRLPSGRCLLMLRPERLRLAGDGENVNRLRGTVQAVVYQGDTYLLQVRLLDGSLVGLRGISTGGALAALPEAGAPVTLGLAAEDTVLLPDPAA